MLMLAEAFVVLAFASLAIQLLPFRKVVATMRGSDAAAPADLDEQVRVLRQCRWAVQSWADRVPWKAVCFQRGLALHWMLRRRSIPSVMHYGVSQAAERGLTAHVWLTLREQVILGGDVTEDYACLATFPASTAEAGPLQPLLASRPVQKP
jgi:hypothetical protein